MLCEVVKTMDTPVMAAEEDEGMSILGRRDMCSRKRVVLM